MRGLKYLFTVPEGEKITEKHLTRVLVSSICSILLCMSCLVSTTWAWFAVSIENTGNVIEVGAFNPKVTVQSGNTELTITDGVYMLSNSGVYSVEIDNTSGQVSGYCYLTLYDADEQNDISYVTEKLEPGRTLKFTVQVNSETISVVSTLGEGDEIVEPEELLIPYMTITPMWGTPPSGYEIGADATLTATVIEEENIQLTEPTTEPTTVPSTDPNGEQNGGTTSVDPTTEPTTAPTTEPTTEPSTEPTVTEPEPTTEPTTAPTEPETTEPTTEPTTAPTTAPTEETTVPPATEPEVTEPVTTEPSTEPVISEPTTAPTEPAPTTEPTTTPTEPETTAPTTEPTTEPTSET